MNDESMTTSEVRAGQLYSSRTSPLVVLVVRPEIQLGARRHLLGASYWQAQVVYADRSVRDIHDYVGDTLTWLFPTGWELVSDVL